MRKWIPMLLVASIAGCLSIFNMSLGYHPLFGANMFSDFVKSLAIFFPLILQFLILIFSFVAFIKLKEEGFSKYEKINIFGSMVVSFSFILLFVFVWYTIMTQGLH